MSELPTEFTIEEIEKNIHSSNTKLDLIKRMAKHLKIKLTKKKKEELRKEIINKIYDPTRFFEKNIQEKQDIMTKNEAEDKAGKDWWLHKFTKYGVSENYKLVIVEKNHFENDNPEYLFNFGLCENGRLNSMYYRYNLKTPEDTEIVKTLAKEKNIEVVSKSRVNITKLERLRNIENVKRITGMGMLCMQSYPCVHSIAFESTEGKIYEVKYAGYRQIREIYLKEYDIEDVNFPEHFYKKI
jgi:hypothetical protein